MFDFTQFLQFSEWTLMCILVGYLVYLYAAKDTPIYVKVICFISWLFSFAIVVIIPLDVYFSYHLKHIYGDNDGELEQDPAFQNLRLVWKVFYYGNQILSWVVLPIIYSYENAGEFSFEGKIKRSIKENLWFYAIALILFGFVLIYYVAYGKISFDQLLIFLGALSNSVLLLMVVVLLGHGLVSIPKFHWENRQLEQQLKYSQWETAVKNEEKIEAENKFEGSIRTLYYVSQKPINAQYASYFQKIFEMIPQDYKEKTYKNTCQQFTPQHFNMDKILHSFNEMNMNKVINLNLEVKQAYMTLKRATTKWETVLDNAFLTEDLIENRFNFDFKIRSTLWIQKKGECGNLLENLYMFWQIKLKRYWFNFAGIMTTILSIIILLSQTATFTNFENLNILRLILDRHYGFLTTQILVMMPLVYIMVCVYYSLFNLKTFNFLQFYANQQTDSVALMFGSLNFARVSAPICYNFLQVLNISNNTAYESVMGPMDIVPFFGDANIYFYPIILVILSVSNLFNVYRICLNHFDLNDYEFKEEIDFNKIEEGKSLLYRLRIERERKFLSLQSTNLRQLEGYNEVYNLRPNNELDKLVFMEKSRNPLQKRRNPITV